MFILENQFGWTVNTVPLNMSVLWWKWHMHAKWHEDFWIYLGEPSDLGLGDELQQDIIPSSNVLSDKQWQEMNEPDKMLLPISDATMSKFHQDCKVSSGIQSCHNLNHINISTKLLPLAKVGKSLNEMKSELTRRADEKGLQFFAKLDGKETRSNVVRGEWHERRALGKVQFTKLKAGMRMTSIVFLKTPDFVRSHSSILMVTSRDEDL